jgi:acetyl esterase/lipase
MLKRLFASFLFLALPFSNGWAQQPQGGPPPAAANERKPEGTPRGTPRPLDSHGVAQKWLDVAYANGSPAQKLDIYLPNEGKGPFPVIVAIHGGGWEMGDKNTGEVNAELWGVTRGYAVASINYRLSGEAIFPAAVYDVKAAIRFLRANAKKYHLNPNKFAAWGDSAGGHLAAITGTSAGVKELEDLSMGNANQSSAVQVVADYFGPTNLGKMDELFAKAGVTNHLAHNPAGSPESRFLGGQVTTIPDKVKQADPATYISSCTCPFIIVNGTKDLVVPPQSHVEFAAALEKAIGKNKVVHIVLEGAGHGGPQFTSTETLDQVFAFLDKYLK